MESDRSSGFCLKEMGESHLMMTMESWAEHLFLNTGLKGPGKSILIAWGADINDLGQGWCLRYMLWLRRLGC